MKSYWKLISTIFLLLSVMLLLANNFNSAIYLLLEAVLFALYALYEKEN